MLITASFLNYSIDKFDVMIYITSMININKNYEVKVMSNKINNAKNLYIRGIQDGEIDEVLSNYMGESYTQHSTGVGEGKEGFRAFFLDFFKRNPKREIQIVRAIEDGDFVFLHVLQNLNDGSVKWITMDVFRANEAGKIVEHWDVIDAYPECIVNEDPILGEFCVKDLEKTESNKKTIRLFLTEVLQNKELDKYHDYVSNDIVEHSQWIQQENTDFKEAIKKFGIYYDFVFKVIGEGDHEVAYSQVIVAGKAYAIFDLFRLKDGKIVEHWDNREIVPSRDELTNSGKF